MFVSILASIFSSEKKSHWSNDLFTAIPRIVCGYLLCTSFGWSKCPVPAWFVSDVAALGFPAPLFFAWAAVLSEVVGGALLVLGLATRVASGFLICTMLSAIFLQKWHGEVWEMLPAMGFLWVAIFGLMQGSGRFGLDYFISQKIAQYREVSFFDFVKNTNLAVFFTLSINLFIPLFFTTFVATNTTFAQSRPLVGSGKIIEKTYDLKDFDKVKLADLDGNITIVVGKKFGITVAIDDNLEPIFNIKNENGTLIVALEKNKNNRRYVENSNIKIRITMPEISVLQHSGNSTVKVEGIQGRYFRAENEGNGSLTLSGKIDKFDLKQRGNGNVEAKKLVATFATVNTSGNGSAFLNVTASLTAKGEGNGSIINIGKGKIAPLSGIIGNGSVRNE